MEQVIQKILDANNVRIIPCDTPVAALPSGYKIESLENYQKSPNLIRQKISTIFDGHFVQYVNIYKTEHSIISVTPNLSNVGKGKTLATCIIDYHEPMDEDTGLTAPHWGSHVISLLAQPSPEYQLLIDLDGQILGQADFALKLRDIARFSTSHKAAELIDIVRTMTLTSAGSFESIEDDFSGSVKFGYDVQVKASAGTAHRKLEVPRTITFDAPLLTGGPIVQIETELLYRIPKEPGGKVQLGLRLPNRRWQEIEAIESTAKQLADKTGLLTIVGEIG